MSFLSTVCPRCSDPLYIVTYYIKCVTTSWKHMYEGKFFIHISCLTMLIKILKFEGTHIWGCRSSPPPQDMVLSSQLAWVLNFSYLFQLKPVSKAGYPVHISSQSIYPALKKVSCNRVVFRVEQWGFAKKKGKKRGLLHKMR